MQWDGLQDSAESPVQFLKRRLSKPQTFLLRFLGGLGPYVEQELQAICAAPLSVGKPIVPCLEKDASEIVVSRLPWRVAQELLLRMASIHDLAWLIVEQKKITRFRQLEAVFESLPWSLLLPSGKGIGLRVRSRSSYLFHESAIGERLQKIVKDAGIDGEHEAPCQLFVDLYRDRLRLWLSLNGRPLYRRGYRGEQMAVAPLREDLAAGLYRQASTYGWDAWKQDSRKSLFVPFVGSGTLLFEALLQLSAFCQPETEDLFLAQRDYCFRPAWEHIRNRLQEQRCRIYDEDPPKIWVNDWNDQAWRAFTSRSRAFFATAGCAETLGCSITEINADFFSDAFTELRTQVTGQHVFIPLNPPYGRRIAQRNPNEHFYASMAQKLKDILSTANRISGFVLCPDEPSWRAYQKGFSNTLQEVDSRCKTIHVTQGGIDLRVLFFDSSQI